MASEDVTIILNEREGSKAKVAESLLSKLRELGISASRIAPDPKIEKIIKQRNPKVIVLDYVIGDFTTGLDLVENLSNSPEHPEFIFFTDEPSVPVAVAAMRLGAINYFEIESPDSVPQIIDEIKNLIKVQTKKNKVLPQKELFKFKNFIAQSKITIPLLEKAKSIASTRIPLSIIYGPKGSGKSALAESIFEQRESSSFLKSCDWDLYTQSAQDLIGVGKWETKLKLGQNLSLIIDHLDEADEEIIETIEVKLSKSWLSANEQENDSFLTICTQNIDIARAWSKIFEIEFLEIPSLDNRKNDIPPLARRFAAEAQELSRLKAVTLDTQAISFLTELSWPGNVKQLRAVVIDGCIRTADGKREFKDIITENMERWNKEYTLVSERIIDPLSALIMLESTSFNYRIAAAKLGISVHKLRSLLVNENSTINRELNGYSK